MKRFMLAAVCITAFTTATLAADGVTLEIETKRMVTTGAAAGVPAVPGLPAAPGQKPTLQVRKQVVKAQGEKLNMEVPADDDLNGERSTALFNGHMTILHHPEREFEELTEEKIRGMLAEMERARKGMGGAAGVPGGMGGMGGGAAGSPEEIEASKQKLRDAIAKLPPQTPPSIRKMLESQLETLEKLSRPKGEDGKPAPYDFKPEGRTMIEGKNLIKTGVWDGAKRIKDIYSAPIAEAGPAGKAYKAYVAYATFLQKLRDMMPEDLPILEPSLTDEILKIEGMPFITFVYGPDGKIVEEVRVKNAVEATHADGIFVRPVTYTERDSFAPKRGGGFGR